MNVITKVRVKWAPEYGIGTTDAIDTYCCELYPSWYVIFDGDNEGHYFHKKDLEVL